MIFTNNETRSGFVRLSRSVYPQSSCSKIGRNVKKMFIQMVAIVVATMFDSTYSHFPITDSEMTSLAQKYNTRNLISRLIKFNSKLKTSIETIETHFEY